MANEDLIDEHLPFDSSERSEVELIDHLFGFKAGAAGEPSDETRVSHGNEDGRMAKNRIQRRIVHEKSYYFWQVHPAAQFGKP